MSRAKRHEHVATTTGEANQGANYTPGELAYLRKVERLRKSVRFPSAVDYYRLARECLGLHAREPQPAFDTTLVQRVRDEGYNRRRRDRDRGRTDTDAVVR